MEYSDSHDYDARVKVNESLFQWSSTRVGLPIATLTEQIKAVISEKFRFEHRDKSKLLAFWKFWMIWILTNGSKQMVSNQILLYRIDVFDSSSDGINQICSCWEKLWQTRYINNNSTFRNFRTITILTHITKPPI